MRIVTKPLDFTPHACAATGRDDGELIDFGVNLVGYEPRLYLKREKVEEAGALMGMVTEAEHRKALEANRILSVSVSQLEGEVKALEERIDALEIVQKFLNNQKEPSTRA